MLKSRMVTLIILALITSAHAAELPQESIHPAGARHTHASFYHLQKGVTQHSRAPVRWQNTSRFSSSAPDDYTVKFTKLHGQTNTSLAINARKTLSWENTPNAFATITYTHKDGPEPAQSTYVTLTSKVVPSSSKKQPCQKIFFLEQNGNTYALFSIQGGTTPFRAPSRMLYIVDDRTPAETANILLPVTNTFIFTISVRSSALHEVILYSPRSDRIIDLTKPFPHMKHYPDTQPYSLPLRTTARTQKIFFNGEDYAIDISTAHKDASFCAYYAVVEQRLSTSKETVDAHADTHIAWSAKKVLLARCLYTHIDQNTALKEATLLVEGITSDTPETYQVTATWGTQTILIDHFLSKETPESFACATTSFTENLFQDPDKNQAFICIALPHTTIKICTSTYGAVSITKTPCTQQPLTPRSIYALLAYQEITEGFDFQHFPSKSQCR